MFLDIFASLTKRSLLLSSDECSYSEKRDLENEQQILASYMRARTGDLGPGPATARRGTSHTSCRSVSHMIAWRLYAIPDRLQYSRLALYTPLLCIQFSTAYTILVRHHYNSRPTIQRWTCHAMLDRPCNSLPAMQLYTGEPVSREPVSREPMPRVPVSTESMLGIFALDI